MQIAWEANTNYSHAGKYM